MKFNKWTLSLMALGVIRTESVLFAQTGMLV